MMLCKCCTQYSSKFGKLSSGHRTGKSQFSFQSQRMFKLPHKSTHLRQLVKQCTKFSKPGFNSMWTMSFQMLKLDLEKAEELEIKLPTSVGSLKKQETSRKTSYFCLIDSAKAFDWITVNCGKFWKTWEYQTTWLASWEICMQVRKQQLELNVEQQTGSK